VNYYEEEARLTGKFIRHHYIFRTHPDINTPRLTFNHELSIEWEVCTPPHFNLQYTQAQICVGPRL
jgi:hypothetical protein